MSGFSALLEHADVPVRRCVGELLNTLSDRMHDDDIEGAYEVMEDLERYVDLMQRKHNLHIKLRAQRGSD